MMNQCMKICSFTSAFAGAGAAAAGCLALLAEAFFVADVAVAFLSDMIDMDQKKLKRI